MKRLALIMISLVALMALEHFAVKVSAYALGEMMTGYRFRNLVVLVSVAFVVTDAAALYVFSEKYPDFATVTPLGGWLAMSVIRAGLIWRGLVLGLAATHPEWLAVAPALAAVFWLLNIALPYWGGRAFQMRW